MTADNLMDNNSIVIDHSRVRGKQAGCVAGAGSAGLLSQQYIDEDGGAIRVNINFVSICDVSGI